MNTHALFFLGAFSLSALTAAGADSAPPPAVPPDAPHATLALTMNEAVVRALDANLEITVERLKPQIAEQRRRAAVGILDLHLETALTSESLETPQNTRDFFATGRSVEVLDEDNIRFEGTLGGQLPTGTRYNITIKSYSLKNTLNREALARFYPEFTSSAAFTVTQPLLRGLGRNATMVEANVATSELKASEHALRGRVDQIAANVLDAYVEAAYGRELVHVITDRIALADRLRTENDKRLKQGLMAPIDVLQAESTKAAAEIELIRARSFQTEAENRLRELLFTDFAAAAETSFELVDPLKEVVLTESLPALRSLALERSAEYRVAEQQVVTEKMKVAYARNQMLPRLDLEASYGLNGLAGDLGGSFSDFSQRTKPSITVGVIASVPITFAQERAHLREALLNLRTAEVEVKRTANRIIAQVHTAHARVLSAIQRADSAARAVNTAAAALDAEEKRLANGLTTSFNVLRLQDELAQARVNRLEAVAEGQKAIAVLWGVTGVLLERHQINATETPGAIAHS